MTAYITDESARAFWNRADSLDGSSRATSASLLANAAATPRDLRMLGVPRTALVEGKLHVLVKDKGGRRFSKHVVSHACKTAPPRGSFRSLSKGVMIASPEFLFLQMARKVSFWDAVRLGFELCGTYVIDPAQEGANRREPLTTVSKLRRFLEAAVPMPGFRQALKALDYVIENSNSPMETVLAMLLCLPCRYGGFGLPKPEMNHVVKLSESQARAVGHAVFICDLCWPHASYALEYYGREWHTGVDQVAYDARRMGELQHRGVDIAVVTFEQISSPEQVEALAAKVAKRLGVRLRKPTESCAAARRALHERLIGARGSDGSAPCWHQAG